MTSLPASLSDDQVRWLHTRAQHLAAPLAGTVAQVVTGVVGVQAQDAAAAALAVRARCAGLSAADVEQARVRDRSIVRTWCLRGTLHLAAAGDVGWLLGLLGPIFIRVGRGRRAQLGLDDETGAQAVAALSDTLERRGPLTRDEIVAQLAVRGIHLAGQARPHLLQLAALQGIICHGPLAGRQPTYVLTTDWIDPGPARPPDVAAAELARRYLAAFAPATPEDFAAWSGLSLTEARAAWGRMAPELLEVQVGGAPAWMLKSQADWLDEPARPGPVIRLLPSFDNYLLGYRRRHLILTTEHAQRIYVGGGILHPVLLADGRGIGAWKIKRRRGGIDVVVEPFVDLTAEVQTGLVAEVEDLGRFLGVEAQLRILPVE